MRTIATICFVFVLAISMGVLSVKAQDANTTLPASFFRTSSLDQRVAELEAKLEALKQCDCTCECGKVKAAPIAKLVMVSISGCPACDQWWALEGPRYQSSGWALEHTTERPRQGKLYPYWRVCIGDSCEEVAWLPFNQLDAKVQSILDRRTNK